MVPAPQPTPHDQRAASTDPSVTPAAPYVTPAAPRITPAIRVLSPAKINLTLCVGPLRADGFHPVESLIAPVTLADELEFSPAQDDAVHLVCDDPTIPVDDTNLVRRAARLLAETTGHARGARIALHKRIPAGAGLGGGSSNAAATLRALNENLWQTARPADELERLAARLGSDVPLFLRPGLCVVRGRGERVERVAPPAWFEAAWIALVLPRLHCATKDVYAAFDQWPAPPERPTPGKILACAGVDDAMEALFNDLEEAAAQGCPELRALRASLERLAGVAFRMTGSGAAHYRLFESEAEARACVARCAPLGVRMEIARFQPSQTASGANLTR